jgi:excisionase family DNA binding protein
VSKQNPWKPDTALRPRVVPVNIAASYLGRGRNHVYQLINSGDIRAIKSGGRTLLVVDSLDAYLDRCPPIKPREAPVQTA